MRRLILLPLLLLSACARVTNTPSAAPWTLRQLNTDRSIDTLVTAEPTDFTCTDEILLDQQDLEHYDWATHTLTLKPKAAQRLVALDLVGTPFVVCVGEAPIYTGVFWASYISRSYPGLVIDLLPLATTLTLHIATGYPESPEGFQGQDRRNDVRIWQALYAAGIVTP